MFSRRAWSEIARSLNLSPRELQIVRGIFDDKTEFAIATNLGIAPSTVHTHVERLHRKLAITDRTELVICVMREFLALTVSPANGLPPICPQHAANRCPLGL